MSILLKTHKLLWGRSGSMCAFKDCSNELIEDETETDDESIIGDEAHIVAKSEEGPRGKSDLKAEERDKYDNLILLCRKHHKIVDDQFNTYTITILQEMKSAHEKWVKESLSRDTEKQKNDLVYANYIDEIIRLLDFDNWNGWTSFPLSTVHSLQYSKLKDLEKLSTYIISRFWPGRYVELEDSIYNLKAVVNDFIMVFCKYADMDSFEEKLNKGLKPKEILTEVFYRKQSDETYNLLLEKYEYHIDLLEDLLFEMTRAANLVIENIRKYISPKFRDDEGKLLVTRPNFLKVTQYRVEYKIEEKALKYPYQELKVFMTERQKRDINVGKGFKQDYINAEF